MLNNQPGVNFNHVSLGDSQSTDQGLAKVMDGLWTDLCDGNVCDDVRGRVMRVMLEAIMWRAMAITKAKK